ncbi:MAG: hypothetical protein MPJ78_02055 [Hyphomicrobiaceae bacterium]|nr:hypothetical protein [Hyphomicrobiaceae bacterium]
MIGAMIYLPKTRVHTAYAACVSGALIVGFAQGALAQSGRYETPPSFSAARVLTPELQQGPHHRIVDPVRNDGFLNTYRMTTSFGEYDVVGTDLLKVRVRETEAASKLAEKSSGGQILKSAGKTATKPLETGKGLVTKPGETIKGAVRGVGRFFGRVGAGMDAKDPQRESLVGSLTGAGETKRHLAYQLGVDPYTRFPPLKNELSRLSSAGALGGTAAGVGLAFVPGGAGVAISVGSQTDNLRSLLRDKTAAELEQLGRTELAAMGVPQATTDAFYRNQFMTPTDKAIIVGALKSLGSAQNRFFFVARAARAESERAAFSLTRRIILTSAYQKKVSPVQEFVSMGDVPMVRTAKGLVGIFPVDYLSWTKQFADMAHSANDKRRAVARGTPIEFWITGKASPRTARELKSMGWRLIENADQRLGS